MVTPQKLVQAQTMPGSARHHADRARALYSRSAFELSAVAAFEIETTEPEALIRWDTKLCDDIAWLRRYRAGQCRVKHKQALLRREAAYVRHDFWIPKNRRIAQTERRTELGLVRIWISDSRAVQTQP